jgi:hypothetical protein
VAEKLNNYKILPTLYTVMLNMAEHFVFSSAVEKRRNEYIQRIVSSGMLRRVALVSTDVSEELSASFIRMARIGELGTTLAVASNRRRLRRNTK